MADITMCSWEGCPMKEKCYRFTAPRCEYQTVFIDVPIKDWKCEYLWEREDNMVDTDDDLSD